MRPSASETGKSPSALRLEILDGSIGLLTFDLPNSRANTLGQTVLAELETLIRQLASRTDLKGLILRSGKPGMFIAGADLRELGSALELALGFDYRLAGNNAKTEFGFPEVKVGLFPGWGGTQRLARLLGPSLAAELICAGEAVKAPRARELGIVFDVVPTERLLEEAQRLLQW